MEANIMNFISGTDYNYTYIAIGLGMVISLFLTETLGIMAGGIIVPGYFALYLHNPIKILFLIKTNSLLILWIREIIPFGLENEKYLSIEVIANGETN